MIANQNPIKNCRSTMISFRQIYESNMDFWTRRIVKRLCLLVFTVIAAFLIYLFGEK